MNTTQLSVNPEKLINNLRFSFTQSTTVLGELMQNAPVPPSSASSIRKTLEL